MGIALFFYALSKNKTFLNVVVHSYSATPLLRRATLPSNRNRVKFHQNNNLHFRHHFFLLLVMMHAHYPETSHVPYIHFIQPSRDVPLTCGSVGNRASSLAQQIGIITVWWDICVRKRTNERTTNELMCMCVYVFMVTRTCSAMF